MRITKKLDGLSPDLNYAEMNSPVGQLTILASSQGLHAIFWDVDQKKPKYKKAIKGLKKSSNQKTITQTKKQLSEYFQGKRKAFNLPLVLDGTDFQIQAWTQLLKIPYAKTISYGEQAARIGNKNKARAVGLANGKNPISIIIPCHRVIGSNGRLVGFGGGIDKKAKLLELEQTTINQDIGNPRF